jgi:hypothetical protein
MSWLNALSAVLLVPCAWQWLATLYLYRPFRAKHVVRALRFAVASPVRIRLLMALAVLCATFVSQFLPTQYPRVPMFPGAAFTVFLMSDLLTPPGALFLAKSDKRTSSLLFSLNGKLSPLRVVHLIRHDPDVNSRLDMTAFNTSLRQRDDSKWQRTVLSTMRDVPLIVVDGRLDSEIVFWEAWESLAYHKKLIFLVNDDRSSPILTKLTSKSPEGLPMVNYCTWAELDSVAKRVLSTSLIGIRR